MKAYPLVLCSVVLQMSGAGLHAGETQDRIERRILAGPGATLTIVNTVGDIRVETWDEDVVQITAVKTLKDKVSNPAEALKQIEVEFKSGPTWINLRTVSRRRLKYELDYDLKVPKIIDLDVETDVGRIHIERVTGVVKAKTGVGKIRLDGVNGAIDAVTDVGEIVAFLQSHDGRTPLRFSTDVGDIEATLPTDIAGELKARTNVGRIDADFPAEIVDKSVTGKRLEGRLNGGGQSIDFRTDVGSIKIKKR